MGSDQVNEPLLERWGGILQPQQINFEWEQFTLAPGAVTCVANEHAQNSNKCRSMWFQLILPYARDSPALT